MELSQCFLCLDNCNSRGEGKTSFGLLGRQRKAVFVLRELLRLPPEKLTEFLGKSGGDHPHEWIRFCDICHELVEGAFSHFEEMVQIHRRFRKVQQEVVRRVRQSKGQGRRGAIMEETRRFVKNCDYAALESRFPAGNSGAEWRLQQDEAVVIREEDVIVKLEEEDQCDDIQTDAQPHLIQETRECEETRARAETSTCGGRPKQLLLIREDVVVKEEADDVEESANDPDYQESSADSSPESNDESDEYNPIVAAPVVHKRKMKRKAVRPRKNRPRLEVEQSEMFHDQVTGQLKFRCRVPDCSRVYQTRGALVQHKHKHLENRIPVQEGQWLTCDLCGNSFSGRAGLTSHQLKAHPEEVARPFVCKQCPLTFVSSAARYAHVWKVHQNKTRKRYNTKKVLRRQCPHCPYTATNTNAINAHVKLKHEGHKSLFTCEHCGLGVTRDGFLREHQATQHSVCGVPGCRLPLENTEQLHEHEMSVHGKEVNVFRCPHCVEYVVSRRKFTFHLQLKHPSAEGGGGEEKHVCELCGKGFKVDKYLKYHVWFTHQKARKKKKADNAEQD